MQPAGLGWGSAPLKSQFKNAVWNNVHVQDINKISIYGLLKKYDAKTTRAWDIGRQRVVKYEVLNEFEERVQKEVISHELPTVIPYKYSFFFVLSHYFEVF